MSRSSELVEKIQSLIDDDPRAWKCVLVNDESQMVQLSSSSDSSGSKSSPAVRVEKESDSVAEILVSCSPEKVIVEKMLGDLLIEIDGSVYRSDFEFDVVEYEVENQNGFCKVVAYSNSL